MISREELQLAARNHGMPLEALRHDITPLGLHYLLIHYDIPVVDAGALAAARSTASWSGRSSCRSTTCGRARRVTMPVTMECAGNGRARLEPHVVSQPWLVEAVGTAEWTGVPLARAAGRGRRRDGASRSCSPGSTAASRAASSRTTRAASRSPTRCDERRCSRTSERRAAAAAARLPAAPRGARLVRHDERQVAGRGSPSWTSRSRATRWSPATGCKHDEDDPGTPVTRIEPRSLMMPPGIPDFMTRRRFLPPRPVRLEGRAWSGWAPIERVEVSVDGGALVDARAARRSARARRLDAVVARLGRARGRARAVRPRARRRRPQPAGRAALERRRLLQQRDPAHQRHRRMSGSSRSATASQ